jgi:hypothetical protein
MPTGEPLYEREEGISKEHFARKRFGDVSAQDEIQVSDEGAFRGHFGHKVSRGL